MINAHDEAWHKRYEALSPEDRSRVDGAFDAVRSRFQDNGLPLAFDDRAEQLIAAITRFMIESRD